MKKYIAILFLIFIYVGFNFAQVPDTERNALIDLYNATSGGSWTNNTNWNSTEPVANWYGVTVENLTGQDHVVGLNLENNNLSGILPTSLWNLFSLTTLDLSDNNLEGLIPDYPPGTLEYIDFSKNSLSEIFTMGWTGFANLEYLYFNGNKIKDPLPTEMTGLITSNLIEADFGYNAINETDTLVRDFLFNVDSDWEETQTIYPENVSVQLIDADSVLVDWEPINYNNYNGNFTVFYGQDSANLNLSAATDSKNLNYIIINGLDTSSIYYFKVQTVSYPNINNNNIVLSDFSPIVDIETNFNCWLDYEGEGLFSEEVVNPEAGIYSEDFTFKIRYYDTSNIGPEIHELELNFDSGTYIISMIKDQTDDDFTDGVVYTATVNIQSDIVDNPDNNINYENLRFNVWLRFHFENSNGISSYYPVNIGEELYQKMNIMLMDIVDPMIIFNYINRGTVNVIFPEFIEELPPNHTLYLTVDPVIPLKNRFLMVPILLNPDFEGERGPEYAYIPSLDFRRFNFLSMAPAGDYYLGYQYYRNDELITSATAPSPLILESLNVDQILKIDDFNIKNYSDSDVKLILNKDNSSIQLSTAAPKNDNIFISRDTALQEKEGWYKINGSVTKYVGKSEGRVEGSGLYKIIEDTESPKLEIINQEPPYLKIKAIDNLSGVEYVKITSDSKSFTSEDGIFKINNFNEGLNDLNIYIVDKMGNETVIDQNININEVSILPRMKKNIYNYPNPFNPSTSIQIYIENSSHVTLKIFNMKGKLVKIIYEGVLGENQNSYTFFWDGKDKNNNILASGVYYAVLNINGKENITKMVLLK